jgi:hypothetical protein
MARIAALGRRVAPRDAVPSGKRRNASSVSRRATAGRVLFAVGRVARRLTWATRRRGVLLTEGKNHPGQMTGYDHIMP